VAEPDFSRQAVAQRLATIKVRAEFGFGAWYLLGQSGGGVVGGPYRTVEDARRHATEMGYRLVEAAK
jgi:hypothetical protein